MTKTEQVSGFLNTATNAVKDIGLSLAGFLEAGATAVVAVKDRAEVFKGSFSEDDKLPEAQKSAFSFLSQDKDSLLVYGAIGVIGVAILYSAIAR